MALILGIETSCDETAAALVTEDGARGRILAQRIWSQIAEHQEFGGVVPELASRAHLQHIDALVDGVMNDANLRYEALDAIAVTAGPGLIGGVIVGVMFAKGLAAALNKPLIPVNHLEGHALTVRLTDGADFPYLLLLVSGGHGQFLLVEGLGQYHYLGGTIDDALGEAFDKVAKMLGLGFPGGPAVERKAGQGDPTRFKLPMPLCQQPGCDFSFSGLKTAVRTELLKLQAAGPITDQIKADMCASFQATTGRILENRLHHAIARAREIRPDTRSLVLAGGVAANQHLRAVCQGKAAQESLDCIIPPPKLCTDNAAMIAWAGLEHWRGGNASKIGNGLSITPRARWPLAGSQ